MSAEERLQLLDRMLTEAADLGLIMRTVEDEALDGRMIELEGRPIVNFGSCSYLGLEMDMRLRQAVCDAVMRYGTQFSSSRTYLSAPAYRDLEESLESLFGAPVVVSSSTTLGHLSGLPVLVGKQDAVILDQQVHHSVQMAAQHLRIQGSHIEVVRHSRMDMLEERIEHLRKQHDRVWYMADGVYSMYADLAPAEELRKLLDRFEQLHLYVDDSHGMSWAGEHGRGQFLEAMGHHDRLVVAASLNKGFAAAGGALVFPHPELKRRVRTCGGPLIFSGPIQPPMLGAALASTKIHLSPEIGRLQAQLRARVDFFNRLVHERGLPLVSPSEAPIRCIGLGLPRTAYALARRLLDEGFFVNVASFPAVPMKQAGIRVPLTVHHTFDDIERLVRATAKHLPKVLEKDRSTIAAVAERFGIDVPRATSKPIADAGGAKLSRRPAHRSRAQGLKLQHENSVAALDPTEWNRLLGHRGTFTVDGLRLLEDVFRGNDRESDNWDWHYFSVRDVDGEPILATFFTHALWKDDMLASPAVSERVEARRRHDPDYLTTRVLAMGSLLTEGDHLYLDRSRDWRAALDLLFDAVGREQERLGSPTVVLRDFVEGDAELQSFFREAGFVSVRLPDSHVLDLDFQSDEDYLGRLSYRARRHQLREVRPLESCFEVEVIGHRGRVLSYGEVTHLRRLYEAVAEQGFELSTFALPEKLFGALLRDSRWEFLLLRIPSESGGPSHGLPVAFGACFVGDDHFAPMIAGLDYNFVHSHGIYRQLLWQVLQRAKAHGAKRVLWGMAASLEKRRFGARAERRSAYFQASDHYSDEVLQQMEADVAGSDLHNGKTLHVVKPL